MSPGSTQFDPALKIGVLNRSQYRAEALALAIGEKLGREALAVTEPDLLLLGDFMAILIDLDGEFETALSLIRTLTKVRPLAKVIFLGLVPSGESAVKIAEAGASGYVTATASFQELLSVLNSIQEDGFACPPDITYSLFSHLAHLAEANTASPVPSAVLTARERQVTRFMSYNLPNKEIAERLGLSEHTVKNHVHRILRKLGADNRRVACLSY